MTKQQREERAKMVLAMEYICRQLNDEVAFNGWLMCGVPDGDIQYGETDPETVDEYYLEDNTFRELMECFLRRMSSGVKHGGLYCDGVVTRDSEVK